MRNFERTSSEILRALRGKRSQVAFARRLGYIANPITDWENGRRFPTAGETFRAAHLVNAPVQAAFSCLAPHLPDVSHEFREHAWLAELKGSRSLVELARQTGLSRYSVGRILAGTSEARLPEFLRLLDAITGRLHEWAHVLVGVENVPSLYGRYMEIQAARRLALERPWSEALLRILETENYRKSKKHSDHDLAQRLGIEEDEVRDLLLALLEAGVVERSKKLYSVAENLTVDTTSSPEELRQVRKHWAQVGLRRLDEMRPDDWFAYNVIAVSEADSERVERRLRAAYREVRSIVAESAPAERGAVLMMQLLRF